MNENTNGGPQPRAAIFISYLIKDYSLDQSILVMRT